MNEIKVRVTKYDDRKFFVAYYDCPLAGRRIYRSTKKTTRRDAERFAAVWEAELHDGRYKPPSKITWADFRARYESEHLASLAVKTKEHAETAFRQLEKHCRPKRLADVTADRLSHFQKKLRENGLAEASIRSYLGHIRAALRWAQDQKLLHEAPKVPTPKRAKNGKVMKGRPVRLEEFERMLLCTVTGLLKASAAETKPGKKRQSAEAARKRLRSRRKRAEQIAPAWQFFLKGLWTSGLRLSEAMVLSWDDRPDRITVDLSGRYPMMHIRSSLEKGNKDRLYPISPEFAELLREVPLEQRHGDVFSLPGMKGEEVASEKRISKILSSIGEAAGVVVAQSEENQGAKKKHASAHDLRRSFGTRWAARVMPAQLKELMRHTSIDTTMRYYVQTEATELASAVWDAYRKAEGGDSPSDAHSDAQSAEKQPGR